LVAPTDTVLKTVEAVLLRVKKLTRINVPAATDWRLGVRTFNRGLEVLNTSKDWIYYLSWVPLATHCHEARIRLPWLTTMFMGYRTRSVFLWDVAHGR